MAVSSKGDGIIPSLDTHEESLQDQKYVWVQAEVH